MVTVYRSKAQTLKITIHGSGIPLETFLYLK
jgi:hypothetical protein